MGKSIGITSGKGGVGKSTVSVGLATAFCELGKKTLLVDMDIGLRCLDLLLGVDKTAVFDLADVLMGKDIEDAVYPCEQTDGLYLIPAPSAVGTPDAYSFTTFAAEITKRFDIVIFDFPAGLDLELYSCLPKDTVFLTVAVPEPVSVRAAAAISTELSKRSLQAGLIVNRFAVKSSFGNRQKSIDGIIDEAVLKLIGIVPESYELALLSLEHTISRKSRAAAAFMRIARRLDGEHILLPKPKKI